MEQEIIIDKEFEEQLCGINCRLEDMNEILAIVKIHDYEKAN